MIIFIEIVSGKVICMEETVMHAQRLIRLLLPILILVSALWFVAPQVARAECGVTHTVLYGQNLFRIALRYGVNMYDVAAANGITDVSRIYAGQVLVIPCPAGVSPSASSAVVPVTTYPATTYPATTVYPTPSVAGALDCTGFRATSPLDGLPDGATTFYWDLPRSPAGIEIYQVIVVDDRGRRVASFDTAGGIYSVYGDVSFNGIGGRMRFSWYVTALAGGAEVCRTQVTTVNRAWNPYAGISP
jgi:hypothetical protein